MLQKRLVRIITNSEFLAHTDPLFYNTKILKVKDIYTYLIAIKAYKNNIFNNFNYGKHAHNTRNRNRFAIPNYRRLQITERSLTYCIYTPCMECHTGPYSKLKITQYIQKTYEITLDSTIQCYQLNLY